MSSSSDRPSERLFFYLHVPEGFGGMGFDFATVELGREDIEAVLERMDDVERLAESYDGSPNSEFDDPVGVRVIEQPGTFGMSFKDPEEFDFDLRPVHEALSDIERGDAKVAHLPGELPVPDLTDKGTVAHKLKVSCRFGDSSGWWRMLHDEVGKWFETEIMDRDKFERLDRKLACYEMQGERQREELEAIREEDPSLFEEMMDDGRQMITALGSTEGYLPEEVVLEHTEPLTSKELTVLMRSEDREVRSNVQRLLSLLDRDLEDLDVRDEVDWAGEGGPEP